MDCLLTKCIPIAHNIQTKCRLSAYFACIPIANLAHSHLLMVGPKRPAVDKLRAVEGQTTLGLPASRPIEAPGSNQHGSVPLTPRRPCKNKKHSKEICMLLVWQQKCVPAAHFINSLHYVCIKCLLSLHIYLMHTWCITTEKCAKCTLI